MKNRDSTPAKNWDSLHLTHDLKSLMTPLALVEGEVLEEVSRQGHSHLKDLADNISWPRPLVIMAAGSLVRQGVLEAKRSEWNSCIELSVR